MKGLIKGYLSLSSDFWKIVGAELTLNLVNSVFFLIFNIYCSKSGYSDGTIAGFLSARFSTVLLFAIPFGIFIKSRRLLPYIKASLIIFPLAGMVLTYSVHNQLLTLIYLSSICMGLGESMFRISMLPYILRNLRKQEHTKAISLNFATWSFTVVIAGILIFGLNAIDSNFFDERRIFYCISAIGITGLAALMMIRSAENVPSGDNTSFSIKDYDWKHITRAALPTFLIAVGAGLTIPFINLFFFHTFSIDFNRFALMGTITATLVFLSTLMVPVIKKWLDYDAIVYTQAISTMVLITLATTDFLQGYAWAVYLAIGCYLLRQPFMNLAGPLTSEMTMYYVGKNNQELMSAIISSIWSGSWFVSSIIFKILRDDGLRYGTIFYITAALYVLGIIAWFYLIKDYRKKIIEAS